MFANVTDENRHIFDKLEEFNQEIKELLQKRKDFMDSAMEKVSPYKIGEEYVNVKTGETVKVESVYRYWGSDRDILLDNSLWKIYASFDNGDNESRYGVCLDFPYVKAEDYKNKTKEYYEKIELIVKSGRLI